jgi:beta-lactamase class A
MTPKGGVAWITAAVMAGAGVVSWLAQPASAAAASSAVTCWSAAHPAAAAKLSRDIRAARRGRVSAVGAGLYDPGLGLGCWLNANAHFDSASVVKATILGALLRKTEQQRRHLTRTEASLAAAMITRSDNNAASALWADVGRTWLQHFLNLAQMTHTALGPGGYWGLTQITAHDEVFLLQLLINPNGVLDSASRGYELGLMAKVIRSQRWGVPAGAPAGLTVHVKNGWLPRSTHGWRIHSIGCFTGRNAYSVVVLTQDNPTMTYGITTVQAIARVINRDLNPRTTPATAPAAPMPMPTTPDENLPALGSIP